ncbi:MAG: T9SS type A sorting domain-containing protein, partial [Gramella sp.]|nr:T9SS type A sorting domain-containing protein [Christiangramia sp.]
YYKISEQDFTTTIEETGFFNDRFELVFRSQEENAEEEEEEEDGPVEETPIEAEKPELSPQDVFLGLQYYKNTDEIALSNPDLLNITQVEIYSISGQKIMSFDDIPTERSVQLRIRQKLSSAVYVVKLYSGKKVYSKKVIISK